ncbi:hypothetical protein AB0C31_50090, partial [Actinoplanes philippinensis]
CPTRDGRRETARRGVARRATARRARTVLRLSRGEAIDTPRVELATKLMVRESTRSLAESGGQAAQ